jgi:hypothetical protein
MEAAPFFALATGGPDGLVVAARRPGRLRARARREDPHDSDRRGDNRIDSLRKLIHDPRVALLFSSPTDGETIRVNGRAAICTDPEL